MLFIDVLLDVNLHVVDSVGVSFEGELPFALPECIGVILEAVHLNYNIADSPTMEG